MAATQCTWARRHGHSECSEHGCRGCWSVCFSNNWSTGIFLLHHNYSQGSTENGLLQCSKIPFFHSKGLHLLQWSSSGMWWNGKWAEWMHCCQICCNCLMLSRLRNVQHLVKFIGSRAVVNAKGGQTHKQVCAGMDLGGLVPNTLLTTPSMFEKSI